MLWPRCETHDASYGKKREREKNLYQNICSVFVCACRRALLGWWWSGSETERRVNLQPKHRDATRVAGSFMMSTAAATDRQTQERSLAPGGDAESLTNGV